MAIKFTAQKLSNEQAAKIDRSGLLNYALMKAWQNRKQCRARSEEEARAWVGKIYSNVLLDALKRQFVKRETGDPEVVERSPLPASADPATFVARCESEETVLGALDRLSEDHRTVMTLHYVEGMKLSDVADLLHLSVDVTKKRAQRAREILKKELSRMEL